MTDDTVAKPLVKDRFWILSRNGESVGLLNRVGDSQYIVTQNGRRHLSVLKRFCLTNIQFVLLNIRQTIL